MNRLLPWQTAVQRLLLIVVALLAAQYGLGRAVQSIVCRSGNEVVNAPLEVAHARVSANRQDVVLSHVRCPNPHQPSHDLLEADRVSLQVAAAPLFHKQTVIDHGTVVGLRVNLRPNQSDTSDASQEVQIANNWFADAAGERAAQWLKRVDERFGQDLVRQFESVARTDEVCMRWTAQSDQLDGRMRELKNRAKELQQFADAARNNPLRHREELSSLPNRVRDLTSEIEQFNAELARVLDTLETDCRSIVAARGRDEQFVNDCLNFAPIPASELTTYLLRRQVAGPLDELLAWLRWLRQVAPAEPAPPGHPSRGEDIVFAGCRPVPNLLIRALELRGASRVGGQPVELRGMLSDFASSPSLHSRPIQLRMKAAGSLPMDLLLTVDRTRETARDVLAARFEGLLMPKLALGRADELSLSAEPSMASASAHVVVIGKQLNGDIQFVQTGVRLVPMLQGTLSDLPISLALHENLRRVDSLAVRIALSGTLDEPRCEISSNLGPAVAEAIHAAVQNARRSHARTLLARGQRQVDERLASLERRITQHRAQFVAQVSSTTSDLAAMTGPNQGRKRLSHEQLGRRLPANSLFR